MGSPPGQLSCRELVELVTDYLDGELDPDSRARFEAHLNDCDGCAAYLEQIRSTVRMLGTAPEAALTPEMRDRLLHAFRRWRASRWL